MVSYGITEIQNKPSLMKEMDVGEIIDKRASKKLGYFISSKYKDLVEPVLKEIERAKKLEKLERLKKHQDLEFAEIGVDDGL